MSLEEDMITLVEALKSRIAAGMIVGERITYTAFTLQSVAPHQVLAPSGYELAGWMVTPIGGGGGGGGGASATGGWGGMKWPLTYVPLEWLGGASTIAITPGTGGLGSTGTTGGNGADSTFGDFVVGPGGLGARSQARGIPHPLTPVHIAPVTQPTTTTISCVVGFEGMPGSGAGLLARGGSCPSGLRGGGGAGAQEAGSSSNRRGGAVYPHPNSYTPSSETELLDVGAATSLAGASSSLGSMYRGLGNPASTAGAAGHSGFGDGPGGGGNAGTSGGGGGGFPGGGGGASSEGTGGNGAGGAIYVYPLFRKA